MLLNCFFIFFLFNISFPVYPQSKTERYEGKDMKYLLRAYRDFQFYSEEKLDLDKYVFVVEYYEEYVKVKIFLDLPNQKGGDAIYYFDLEGTLKKRILGA